MPWIYDEVGIFWRIKHSDRIRIDTSMNGVKTLEKKIKSYNHGKIFVQTAEFMVWVKEKGETDEKNRYRLYLQKYDTYGLHFLIQSVSFTN